MGQTQLLNRQANRARSGPRAWVCSRSPRRTRRLILSGDDGHRSSPVIAATRPVPGSAPRHDDHPAVRPSCSAVHRLRRGRIEAEAGVGRLRGAAVGELSVAPHPLAGMTFGDTRWADGAGGALIHTTESMRLMLVQPVQPRSSRSSSRRGAHGKDSMNAASRSATRSSLTG